MTYAPRAGAGPLVRSFTGVIAFAVLLAMLALPAAADPGPVRLGNPSVSPSSGTIDTPFVFTVTYRHRAGSPPASIRVVVGGNEYGMVSDGGDHWKRGVLFTFAGTLPPGDHAVLFVAADPDGYEDTIAGGEVSVGQPQSTLPPSPTPGPQPTPGATPATTPPPPAATPAPPAAVQTAKPDPTADAAGPDGAAPDESTSEPPMAGVGGAGPTGPETGNPDSGDPAAPDGRDSGEAFAGLPGSWGELTRYLEALGLDPTRSPLVRLVPVMIWTTGGVALLMAFGFFGKRRRDGEPPEPDEVLSAKAARGTGEAATAALVPAGAAPTSFDLEALMPRWRRPSLLQARKADPLRDGASPSRMSFDHAAVAPIDGYERRLIRYLVVQLLDTPDEFRGSAIGAVAQGDEVQLLERSGTYWRVLCPDGSAGWIHRMTLGDVVGEPPSPSARETWATTSVEADEVDDDVLVAFMTARGRA